MFPVIPIPPASTNAPVTVLVELTVLLIFKDPVSDVFPETNKFAAIRVLLVTDKPPDRTRDACVDEVASIVLVRVTRSVIETVPVKVLAPLTTS